MLMIGDRLNSYSIAAGEPWIMSVQMRANVGNAIIDWSNRRLVLSFYDSSSALVDQIEGVYTSDSSGAYFAFIRDGRFSEALGAKSGITVELSERLLNGRAIIASGPLSVVRSSPGVATFGTSIGETEYRFTIYFDAAGVVRLIEPEEPRRYIQTTAPPPSFTSPAGINSDGTPQVGETLIGIDGVVANGSVTGRAWLRAGTVIATGSTYAPTQTGSLTYRATAEGPGGTTTSQSTITVAAATPPPPPYLMDFRRPATAAYAGAML